MTGEKERELGGSCLISNENKSQMSGSIHRIDAILPFEGGTSDLDNTELELNNKDSNSSIDYDESTLTEEWEYICSDYDCDSHSLGDG